MSQYITNQMGYVGIRRASALLALALCARGSARAQTPPAADAFGERLEVLERAVRELKAPAAKESPWRVGGQVQAESRWLANDAFAVRRARPIFEGKLPGDFAFRLMPDFGRGQTQLADAYAEWTRLPHARVRLGKFKAPLGLEQLQSDPDTRFIEGAFPSALISNRDIGAQVGGELLGRKLSYAAGVFNGALDGSAADADTNRAKDLAARLFATPLPGWGVGVGASAGRQDGQVEAAGLPAYKTIAQKALFSYRDDGTFAGSTLAAGRRTRLVPQTNFYCGPVGVTGEYALEWQRVSRGGTAATLRHQAWQVSAIVMLTGEPESYKAVTPKRSLGAFELMGRVHELKFDGGGFPFYVDPNVSSRRARSLGCGLTWYLNASVKVTTAYEHTRFAGAGRNPEDALFSRVQVVF